jgi:hypothetical protein
MALTLSTTQILELVMDAFKVRLPFLASAFATDFSSERAKFNQTVNARIAGLPTVRDYDATTGYKANAAESKTLMNDVPVTINQHKHVPIKLDFLDQASAVSQINLLEEATMNCGYVLAKSIADYCFGLIVEANFSQESIFTDANADLDMLAAVRTALNDKGATTLGRYGIVNSAVMTTLTSDSRIASGDFHGQRIGAEALGNLRAIQGFANIWEYPDFPANAENLSAFFGTKESIILATRVPSDTSEVARAMGIPQIASFETMTDEDTGLTLLGIKWIEQGTFDVYVTVAVMYGAVAGAQGGDAGTKTDYAGHRIITESNA